MLSELDEVLGALGKAGGSREALGDAKTAHLVASGHRILSSRAVDGLAVDARGTRSGIRAKVTVLAGVRLERPVHLCFGVLHKKGTQRVDMRVTLETGAQASFIAHCVFPRAEKVRHIMNAVVEVGDRADMRYSETHYHGTHGGIEVIPKASVSVGRRGMFVTDFSLTSGRVGRLSLDYTVDAGPEAVVELSARVFGHGNDEIRIRDRMVLSGQEARGLIKTRVAVEHAAIAEVTGITEGNAAGARGHVDCMEIVKDRAVARAVPIVQVNHPQAKVTHEAAIGSVDKRQMETLMAHGLSPEEAVDVIVKGILR